MNIDCSFPGGNIVVERIEEDAAWVHQDLRDTGSAWFYWYFRVTQARARTVRFFFTESVAIGARGPAVSLDGGDTWEWLGVESVEGNSFVFTFTAEADSALFGMTIPYTDKNWKGFLKRIGSSPFLKNGTLCLTRGELPVEKLRAGCVQRTPEHRVVLTVRHHCCETMASFVLEGLIFFILDASMEGDWLRQHVEFLIVPFMDKDGVEAGDQGKFRIPHDHNRDYDKISIYPETATLRTAISDWSGGRLKMALDLHCPWLKGGSNETLYLVGAPQPTIWKEQQRFSKILEQVKTGPLPFFAQDNLPFGEEWNTKESFAQGICFTHWISERTELATASSIEIPYANARGVTVNAASARQFGADLGRAIACYFRAAE